MSEAEPSSMICLTLSSEACCSDSLISVANYFVVIDYVQLVSNADRNSNPAMKSLFSWICHYVVPKAAGTYYCIRTRATERGSATARPYRLVSSFCPPTFSDSREQRLHRGVFLLLKGYFGFEDEDHDKQSVADANNHTTW